jgi:hypothetical protein
MIQPLAISIPMMTQRCVTVLWIYSLPPAALHSDQRPGATYCEVTRPHRLLRLCPRPRTAATNGAALNPPSITPVATPCHMPAHARDRMLCQNSA